jgi:hypothetical protein
LVLSSHKKVRIDLLSILSISTFWKTLNLQP